MDAINKRGISIRKNQTPKHEIKWMQQATTSQMPTAQMLLLTNIRLIFSQASGITNNKLGHLVKTLINLCKLTLEYFWDQVGALLDQTLLPVAQNPFK